MSEPKRKYDAQMTFVQEIRLETMDSNVGNQQKKEITSKNKRKQVFQPQMIFEIIERIKDL